MPITLESLRRFAVARTLFPPTTLQRAINRCGFVQADPIRAPARAQDLTLRHRVRGYCAGDLQQRYAGLEVEEDVFINYGFVAEPVYALMHPRNHADSWPAARKRRAQMLLKFVRERGPVHPRDVDEHFSHGSVVNYWGGTSNATTHLLEDMHYAGLVRVVRREAGVRIYAARDPAAAPSSAADAQKRLDSLVDIAVGAYAPLPERSLSALVMRIRYAAPQWSGELKAALQRARHRLRHARVEGVDWFWPGTERLTIEPATDVVRLLSPFDPLVWDRRRFEMLWEWAYRFEAYTPAPNRKLGYYALPLLWRDRVIGWANVLVKNGVLSCEFGYTDAKSSREPRFKSALDEEIDRLRGFLRLDG